MAKNIFATFGILAVLLLSIGMVVAAESNGVTLTLNETSLDNVTEGQTYAFLANVTNLNETNLSMNFSTTNWNTTGENIASGTTLTFEGTITIPSSENEVVVIDLYEEGNYSNKLFDVSESITLNYYTAPVVSYMCGETPNEAKLSISNVDINVEEGFGDDEEYWYPLDEVEIEFEVKNKGDDVENIEITFCLYDEEDDNCILDEGDVDLDEDDFDLDHNDDQTVTISFQIDADDLSESNDYQIRIGATGEIDDDDSDFDGNDSCTELMQKIPIITDDNFVILNDIRFEALSGIFGADEFLAGSQLKISGEAWNVGSDDIDDDEVFLEIYSSLLGINEVIEFDSGINALDMESFEKVITIPADAEDKFYKITFTVYEDDKLVDKYIYENSEEDDRAEWQEIISVKANAPAPSVKANLDSVAEVGEELVVKAMITNNGEDNDFTISASSFEAWAELVSVSPQTATITEGESVEVTVVLNPTKEGTQSFMINTIVDGESYKQAVSVKIAEKEGFFTELGLSDTMTYIVIAIIALVILILLVLIAKASRRPAKPQF